MITDPFPWAFITLGAPSTSPWICFESPQYFVTGLRRLQSHSLNPHHQHNEGDNPLYPPSTSHTMLYLRNFQIWSTAPPQAAVAEQLGMEGSNGRRQHHTPAECVTPQDEQSWCSSFSDETGPPQQQKHPFNLPKPHPLWLQKLSSCSALSLFFSTSWGRQALHRLYPNAKDCNRQPGPQASEVTVPGRGGVWGLLSSACYTNRDKKMIVPPYTHSRMKTYHRKYSPSSSIQNFLVDHPTNFK